MGKTTTGTKVQASNGKSYTVGSTVTTKSGNKYTVGSDGKFVSQQNGKTYNFNSNGKLGVETKAPNGKTYIQGDTITSKSGNEYKVNSNGQFINQQNGKTYNFNSNGNLGVETKAPNGKTYIQGDTITSASGNKYTVTGDGKFLNQENGKTYNFNTNNRLGLEVQGSNGKTYVQGSTVNGSNGEKFRVNSDGSFTNQANGKKYYFNSEGVLTTGSQGSTSSQGSTGTQGSTGSHVSTSTAYTASPTENESSMPKAPNITPHIQQPVQSGYLSGNDLYSQRYNEIYSKTGDVGYAKQMASYSMAMSEYQASITDSNSTGNKQGKSNAVTSPKDIAPPTIVPHNQKPKKEGYLPSGNPYNDKYNEYYGKTGDAEYAKEWAKYSMQIEGAKDSKTDGEITYTGRASEDAWEALKNDLAYLDAKGKAYDVKAKNNLKDKETYEQYFNGDYRYDTTVLNVADQKINEAENQYNSNIANATYIDNLQKRLSSITEMAGENFVYDPVTTVKARQELQSIYDDLDKVVDSTHDLYTTMMDNPDYNNRYTGEHTETFTNVKNDYFELKAQRDYIGAVIEHMDNTGKQAAGADAVALETVSSFNIMNNIRE